MYINNNKQMIYFTLTNVLAEKLPNKQTTVVRYAINIAWQNTAR